jgi:uncharacterized protein YndB with AHSA1/START domain
MAAKSDDGDFVLTRVFDAPRDLVFKAWTDPEHLARWWGPHGFSNTCNLDVRSGGKYRIVMHGPPRHPGDFPMSGVYQEIVPPERLVYTVDHSENPEAWHDMIDPKRDKSKGRPAWPATQTITFEDVGGKTKVTIRVRFESAAIREAFLKMGMKEGFSQSLERLESLAATETSDRDIVQTRLFDAPRPLVFKALAEPKHLERWWGPFGFRTETFTMDFRVNGIWRYVMHGPDGKDYHNRVVYEEIVEPERLVFNHAPDEQCEKSNHRTTITLAEEGERTRVTLRLTFASPAARDHIETKYGAIEGGKQTFERLAEYLAEKVGS